jgi:hypothetical protein
MPHYVPEPEQEGPGPVGYLALVLAWLVPGLGHLLLGQRARGLIFAIMIHGLFAAGMVIGGIRAINPPEQPIWTYTQFLSGWPMLVANRVEHATRADLQTLAQNPPGYDRPSVTDDSAIPEREARAKEYIKAHPLFSYHPKVQDVGAVYCGIAGMLNLLVMFDVLLRITGSVREDPSIIKKRRAPHPVAAPVEAMR